MSFVSGVADSVGAYRLIRLTGPVAELRRIVYDSVWHCAGL